MTTAVKKFDIECKSGKHNFNVDWLSWFPAEGGELKEPDKKAMSEFSAIQNITLLMSKTKCISPTLKSILDISKLDIKKILKKLFLLMMSGIESNVVT